MAREVDSGGFWDDCEFHVPCQSVDHTSMIGCANKTGQSSTDTLFRDGG